MSTLSIIYNDTFFVENIHQLSFFYYFIPTPFKIQNNIFVFLFFVFNRNRETVFHGNSLYMFERYNIDVSAVYANIFTSLHLILYRYQILIKHGMLNGTKGTESNIYVIEFFLFMVPLKNSANEKLTHQEHSVFLENIGNNGE